MIALAIVLASLIFGTILYMEWDNRANWHDGRKLKDGSRSQYEKLAYNNPFLTPMLQEAGLL